MQLFQLPTITLQLHAPLYIYFLPISLSVSFTEDGVIASLIHNYAYDFSTCLTIAVLLIGQQDFGCEQCTMSTLLQYQTIRSYCLSRDCPISGECCLKFRLQKPSQRCTLQQKSPLGNNIISPSHINYSFNHEIIIGDQI